MKKKWTFMAFSRGDFKTLERHLNEQAEKGWELDKVGIFTRWKRTQRRDLTYCIDLAKPKQNREARLDYSELCAEGGWELAAFTGSMYIFKSRPGAELIPIHTDPELERKQYNRYYIWNSILSVFIIFLYFGFLVGMGAALGGDFKGYFGSLKYQSLYNWTFLFLPGAMSLWGIWAVWKLADFIRAVLKGRRGEIGSSPRWVMWINTILAFVAGAGAVIFFVGFILETLLGQDFESYLYIWCLVWAGILLYRALCIEKELFRHERRRHVVGGLLCLICFVLLVVGRVALRPGNWSTSGFSAKSEEGFAAYEQTLDLPLVHGEDVGISFEPGKGENVYIYQEIIPAGESWELNYFYGEEKEGLGFVNVGSETVQCFTEMQAKSLVEAFVQGYGLKRYAPWPEDGLSSVEIEWADEAWQGVCSEDGVIGILVLRVGKQVTRMIYPADLLSEENLEIIRVELSK